MFPGWKMNIGGFLRRFKHNRVKTGHKKGATEHIHIVYQKTLAFEEEFIFIIFDMIWANRLKKLGLKGFKRTNIMKKARF